MRGGGASTSLLARNLAINSDAVSNYKYMLGPHRSSTSSVNYHSKTSIVKIWKEP